MRVLIPKYKGFQKHLYWSTQNHYWEMQQLSKAQVLLHENVHEVFLWGRARIIYPLDFLWFRDHLFSYNIGKLRMVFYWDASSILGMDGLFVWGFFFVKNIKEIISHSQFRSTTVWESTDCIIHDLFGREFQRMFKKFISTQYCLVLDSTLQPNILLTLSTGNKTPLVWFLFSP